MTLHSSTVTQSFQTSILATVSARSIKPCTRRLQAHPWTISCCLIYKRASGLPQRSEAGAQTLAGQPASATVRARTSSICLVALVPVAHAASRSTAATSVRTVRASSQVSFKTKSKMWRSPKSACLASSSTSHKPRKRSSSKPKAMKTPPLTDESYSSGRFSDI